MLQHKGQRHKLISKGLSAYLSKADDSMGIIVGWDKDSHLTTKSNLSPTCWILQADVEVLLLLRNVVIYNVHCNLKFTVTWCKV